MELFVVDLEPYLEFYEFSEIDPKIKRASRTLIGPYLLTQSTTNNNMNQRLLRREEPGCGEKNQSCQSCCGEKNQRLLRREEPEIAERRTRDCCGEKNQ
ncbi:hypothetical protein Syun_031597 [Stephania yunnanensis]|uniref:Uncharacterized protein n=1 Tax=Stephania yunnanensis TaxID=152371 RepID=A0AAP0HGU9_9MAGN